jgi:hypothetical protein
MTIAENRAQAADPADPADPRAGITSGVSGQRWRATITPWGRVDPWDGSPSLDWYVAADDRWHRPATEPTLRQERVGDTAVVRTRLRVPNGDVVHTVYSAADGGGFTVIEVQNESTMPIAVAFTRRDVRSERPIIDQPIMGIELPEGSCVMPVGHQARVRIAIAHDGSGAGPLPPDLPTADQVVRGWNALVDRAGRMNLPDTDRSAGLVAEVRARRCELLLGEMARAEDDPAQFLVDLEDLVRMGEPPDPWLVELAAAVEYLARSDPKSQRWAADTGLNAAAQVLAKVGDARALRDLAKVMGRRGEPASRPESPPEGFVHRWLEQRGARGTQMLPEGIPTAWWGVNFEMHGLPVGVVDSRHGLLPAAVSFAVRWHGDRPAVLWEISGEALTLTSPAAQPEWQTIGAQGEALWPPPPGEFTVAGSAAVSMRVELSSRPKSAPQ